MAARFNGYIEREDRGFSLFYANTTMDLTVPLLLSWITEASYLAMDLMKLHYLLRIFQNEGALNVPATTQPPRFISFYHLPMVLWLVEMFLDAIGPPFITTRSSMSPDERTGQDD